MTKNEKTVLDIVLGEVRDNRSEVQEHGKVLARLDERTLAIQRRIDGVESRTNRRSATVAAVVSVVVGVILTFAFNAMGLPRG